MSKSCFIAVALAAVCWLCVVPAASRAESAAPAAFNAADFSVKTAWRERSLLDAGKLHTLGSLLTALKAQPDKEPFTLPAPSDTRLDPADVHDRLLASTLMVGLYYHCKDCHQMHFSTGAGFVVAGNGIVTTCAHMMVLKSERMTQAYPVAINVQGDVFPVDRIIAYDQDADTVVMHVDGLSAPPLPLRANARVGESIYCLGHPGENPFVFTTGTVSRADVRQKGNRSLRSLAVSCDYSPGSSGCPIADASGNVLAQANTIFPQLLDVGSEKAPADHGATTTYATVYNFHAATASSEIARLADAANRPAYTAEPPVAADDAPAAAPASPPVAEAAPSPSPAPANASFSVHCQYDIVAAPTDVSMDGIKSFEQLYAKVKTSAGNIIAWGKESAQDSSAPNYAPIGFTGNTGYVLNPGATGPPTMDNTTSRGIDFRCTFHDRTDADVGLLVRVNDNRETPAAADNLFEVNARLAKGAFTLVKLGPPQKNSQAWLAIQADQFNAPSLGPVKLEAGGKLPSDRKVDFKFTAADGQEVDTTKMRGKVILVDFWATWCGPCVEALPRIQALYDKFHKDGLEIIGINLDQDRAAMDPFLGKHHHPWPQSVSAPAGSNPLADRFEIKGIPFFLLIDKTGLATVIEARDPATDDLIAAQLKQ